MMDWGRKRVRGLRRHFRHLQQRAKRPSELQLVDLTWLTRFQQTFLTVIADPWLCCQEVPRKQEFRARWVERLVRTLPHWHTQLSSRYPAFYLAVELYEPTAEQFCHSRLGVAVNERRRLYENRFGVAQDRPLPAEYLAVPGIETLAWQAYARWSSPYTREEFEQAGTRLANKPHKLVETEQGEPGISVQLGWIWLGQAPTQQ